MVCPVCGNAYTYGGGNSHVRCLTESTERAKDAEFIRTLRSECLQRGIDQHDFISSLFVLLEREILTRGNDI